MHPISHGSAKGAEATRFARVPHEDAGVVSIIEAMSVLTSSAIPALRREIAFAREQTDSLFGLIGPETLYSRPIAERHRLIFYLGHFEAFDWNLLGRSSLNAPS